MSALPTTLGGLCGSASGAGPLVPLGCEGADWACPSSCAPAVLCPPGVPLMPGRFNARRPFIRVDIREDVDSRLSEPPARGMSPGVEVKWSETSPSSSDALSGVKAAADLATGRGACRVGCSLNEFAFVMAGGVSCRPTSVCGSGGGR